MHEVMPHLSILICTCALARMCIIYTQAHIHACTYIRIYIICIHASCLGRERLNLNQFLLTFGWPCYAWPWYAAMYTRPWAS